MPMPTEERVSQLVAGLVERRGFDLEGVEITRAGSRADAQTRVTVVVDSDGAADLDAVAELSSEMSVALDDTDIFGDSPYLLEVTTPGVDRPLTAPRHWRRAQGRKVRITLRPGAEPPDPGGSAGFEARVGVLDGEQIALVLGGKRNPHRVRVPLADIERAVVQVEFSPPGARELELAGGVAPGRPDPGADRAIAADGAISEETSTAAASDPTEGIEE
ncbi:ribosome maturation factor RimP [Nocardia farcinica]|uniref:ribosome maturation factor RimP n=1 Tax=Nocardia farcinica TaxID=37329 RepID=UPI0015F0F925|nr:ribosome maturation factor RimP [Nocardia farcinica]MBA4856799.1 ribosome maturation factor RimP [Nocardia farcinica]MBC9815439.1 ribosome maturation factor RimP [Nocardia farcinica]